MHKVRTEGCVRMHVCMYVCVCMYTCMDVWMHVCLGEYFATKEIIG